jgi:pimeloyl-ACP methyl ester carboxylesterase
MTTFALVHGAFHGAWCWDLLRPELERRGNRTIAMDLPSSDPDAGAARCAEVVGEALEPSREVVLVGHSLGGLVIPLLPSFRKVQHLIYICGLLPLPGSSYDAATEGQPVHAHFTPSVPAFTNPDGSTSFPHEGAVEYFFDDCPPALANWAASQLRPQRWKIMQEVTPLAEWPRIPSTYVLCTGDRVVNPEWSRSAVPAALGTDPVELPGGHSPFLSRPAELAELLVEIATGRRSAAVSA